MEKALPNLRHAICEGLTKRKRWDVMSTVEHTEDHYGLVGHKTKDIYPLIGGKHKKWKVYVFCWDKATQTLVEREFDSGSGNENKIATVWPKIKIWIKMTSGVPVTAF